MKIFVELFVLKSIGGKTTCISLLERFYEPNEGEILIDGIPVRNYDYKFYHQKVRVVSFLLFFLQSIFSR